MRSLIGVGEEVAGRVTSVVDPVSVVPLPREPC